MAERDAWDEGTYEGARRARLRRSLELTVRERLQRLDALADASRRIAAAGRAAKRAADGRHIIPLEGCRPTPLASYLKALGVLRLVAEQADTDVRGWWEGNRFWLHSTMDREALRTFFLEAYRPTPILAPWNGGSGFYPKDNKDGIEPIASGATERFAGLRATIEQMRTVLDRLDLHEKPASDAAKEELLAALRSELDERALVWMDAATLVTDERPRYPPLLGTGGNDGRLEFTNNFMQRLVEVIDPEGGDPVSEAAPMLANALFEEPIPALQSTAIGQFAPGSAGGPNATTSFEGGALVNAWDYILMLEGAVLFAAAATRRLEAADAGHLSYPFTVRPTGSGSGGADLSDEGDARAEIWMPLWRQPVTLRELRALLGEGRATVGRRNARDGLDFARAVARLGVARGIDQFQRFSFLMRYGRTYLATPLNRVPVRANTSAELIDQLERNDWLGRFRRLGRRDEAPARVASLVRRLEDALFDLALQGTESPIYVQRVLITLGDALRYLAQSPDSRARCGPPPRLDVHWSRRANDGTPEYTLALALSSLHARGGSEQSRAVLPMVTHIAPVQEHRRGWDEEAGHRVVWGHGSIHDNLQRVLERRLLEAERRELPDLPLAAWATAPADAVGTWLEGRLDDARIQRLLVGLTLARSPKRDSARRRDDDAWPLPAAYGMLKPFFCTRTQLVRMGWLDEGRRLPLTPALVRSLTAGRVSHAIDLARRRLRIAGFPVTRHLAPSYPDRHGTRLLACLMVPLPDTTLRHVVEAAIPPKPVNHNTTDTDTRENDDAA